MSPNAPPPATRPRPLARRLASTLLLVALAALAAWAYRTYTAEEPGLTVDVVVVDEAGKPLSDARVQATFRPGWRATDDRGRVRLEQVLLRSGEAPGPTTLPAAVQVEAPMHASRSHRPPIVSELGPDHWETRYTLAAFGTLRLNVAATRAKEVRAWVEVPGRPDRVEATSGVALARPQQPATWRVFMGKGDVLVCLEGLTGTAARRRWIPAPPLGMTREIDLEVEDAKPIRGRVRLPFLDAPPTLQGVLDVVGIAEAGRPVPYPTVTVEDDGSFQVPYAGEGRYHLMPRLAFVEAKESTVQGGMDVAIEATALRPWVVIPTAEWGTRAELAQVRCLSLPDETPTHIPLGLSADSDAWRIALPSAGRYRIIAETRGDDRHAPAHGAVDVDVAGPGAHVAILPLSPAPAGELQLTTRSRPDRRQGATVTLLEPSTRTATVFPRISTTARFANVRAGPVRLQVTWRDPEAAPLFLVGDVAADAVLALEATAVEGGLLAVVPPAGAVVPASASYRVAWAGGDSPHGDAAGAVGLIRLAGTRDLNATARLLPGDYTATFTADDEPAVPIQFEIRPGELTTVDLPR